MKFLQRPLKGRCRLQREEVVSKITCLPNYFATRLVIGEIVGHNHNHPCVCNIQPVGYMLTSILRFSFYETGVLYSINSSKLNGNSPAALSNELQPVRLQLTAGSSPIIGFVLHVMPPDKECPSNQGPQTDCKSK